ncbi:MAG: fibronectin type III domain-containing protein [bacterium]
MQEKHLTKINLILASIIIFNVLVSCSKTSPVAQEVIPPFISAVQAINVTASAATINWLTREPTTSQIDYGLDSSYSAGVFNSKLVTSHRVNLRDLQPGKTYHFNVYGVDSNSTLVCDVDRTFTTHSN